MVRLVWLYSHSSLSTSLVWSNKKMFTEPSYGYYVWITSPPRAEQRSPL